jgi:hypothetical protein
MKRFEPASDTMLEDLKIVKAKPSMSMVYSGRQYNSVASRRGEGDLRFCV